MDSRKNQKEQKTVGQPLHYVLDAPGTHREPRKTEDEMEGRFRVFGKTLASYCAKRGPVELSHSLVVHPVLRKILDTPLDEVERG
ncbi:unnamed protein product [Porites evermanni]|uniref:Uncharacterized protein n=1 Tax=Porites evermanni TaxID=104178 RepID=A0ABN8R571_9CNID|nr:unnamed protein product [Porites evermanni]